MWQWWSWAEYFFGESISRAPTEATTMEEPMIDITTFMDGVGENIKNDQGFDLGDGNFLCDVKGIHRGGLCETQCPIYKRCTEVQDSANEHFELDDFVKNEYKRYNLKKRIKQWRKLNANT